MNLNNQLKGQKLTLLRAYLNNTYGLHIPNNEALPVPLRSVIENGEVLQSRSEYTDLLQICGVPGHRLVTPNAANALCQKINALNQFWGMRHPQDIQKKIEHNIHSTIHEEFVKQKLLLADVKTTNQIPGAAIQGDEVLYRGASGISEAAVENFFRYGHIRAPENDAKWYEFSIHTHWDKKTPANAVGVSTTLDPNIALEYIRTGHTNQNSRNWVFVIYPPEGASAVSLAPYAPYGSRLKELTLPFIRPEWIKAAYRVEKRDGNIHIMSKMVNPFFDQSLFQVGHRSTPSETEIMFDGLEESRGGKWLISAESNWRTFKNQWVRAKNALMNKGGCQKKRYFIKDHLGNLTRNLDNGEIVRYNGREQYDIYKQRFQKAANETSKHDPKYKSEHDFRKRYTEANVRNARNQLANPYGFYGIQRRRERELKLKSKNQQALATHPVSTYHSLNNDFQEISKLIVANSKKIKSLTSQTPNDPKRWAKGCGALGIGGGFALGFAAMMFAASPLFIIGLLFFSPLVSAAVGAGGAKAKNKDRTSEIKRLEQKQVSLEQSKEEMGTQLNKQLKQIQADDKISTPAQTLAPTSFQKRHHLGAQFAGFGAAAAA
ncbi:MAG: hypothetical protein IPP74_10060 [Alphaproteobacteria bacterium]|nr:hypothetical protein [Alphaproteobacteria bacterium]